VHSLFNPPAAAANEDWPAWRVRLNAIIFQANSRLGSAYDWLLIALIAVSVGVVVLDSVPPIRSQWGEELRVVE